MRKIIGYIQLLIFILFGIGLVSLKFQSETAHNDVYWIAGVVYLILAGLLYFLAQKYGWFQDSKVDQEDHGGIASSFTILFVFVIGLVNGLQNWDELYNIDSIIPFCMLVIPLASILGYIGYLVRSFRRSGQFKGSLYKQSLVPILYVGSLMLAFSLLVSGNRHLPSMVNETRTYPLVNNNCQSEYVHLKTNTGERKLYNVKQSSDKKCEGATQVKTTLRMNSLGIDYFDEFEYMK